MIKLQNIFVRVKLKLRMDTLLFVVRIKTHWYLLRFFFGGVLNKAILKDSDYNEVDRAECQFATTATVLDNGTQVCSWQWHTALFFYDYEHNEFV